MLPTAELAWEATFDAADAAELSSLAEVLTLIEAFPLVIALNSVEALTLEEDLPFGEALTSVEALVLEEVLSFGEALTSVEGLSRRLTLEGDLSLARFLAMRIPELVNG
jgi:hypothetical protein